MALKTRRIEGETAQEASERRPKTNLSAISQPTRDFALIPTLNRVQVQGEFFNRYFSHDGVIYPGFQYYVDGATNDIVLAHAVQLSYAVQVGQTCHDPRLFAVGSRLYSRIIAAMRKRLADGRLTPEQLAGLVHVLQITSGFKGLRTHPEDWRVHGAGMAAAVQMLAHGTLSEEMRSILSSNFRQWALWDALLRRKKMASYDVLWSHTLPHGAISALPTINQIAAQVPGALEAVDKLYAHESPVPKSNAIDRVSALVALDQQLHDVMRAQYLASDDFHYHLAPVPEPVLQHHLFPSCNAFKNLMPAVVHLMYWGCLLASRQAQRLLLCSLQDRVRRPYPLDAISIERLAVECDEHADDITRTILFILQRVHGYIGFTTVIGPLQLAREWYQRRGYKDKIECCRMIGDYLSTQGLHTMLDRRAEVIDNAGDDENQLVLL